MNAVEWQKKLSRSLPGKGILAIASLAYAAGFWLHRMLYKTGILKSRRFPIKIVCIGNLTAGGTGKTSAVLLAAEELYGQKLKTAILSRGYGRPNSAAGVSVLGNGHPFSWQDCGDEPWMLHQALKDKEIPIFISPNRVQAAEQAARSFPLDVLVMDDGFQHWPLQRDLDVVCVSALDPFGGGWPLPLGFLREPKSGLRRAGLILLTHTDRVPERSVLRLRRELARIAPEVPVVESVHRPAAFIDLRNQKSLAINHMAGRDAASLSAIGSPQQFEEQLKSLNITLKQIWRYPDHHPYTLREFESLNTLGGALPIITTLKDFVRFPKDWQSALSGEVLAFSARLEIVRGKKIWTQKLSLQ